MKFTTPEFLVNRRVNVTVVGAGGTGGYLISLLAQMDFIITRLSGGSTTLAVTLYDDDTVSEYNCGRQNFFPMDIGHPKAAVLINRINAGFGLNWVAKTERFSPECINSTNQVLFTCVDNGQMRHHIGQHFSDDKLNESLWIDGGNGNTDGQIILGHLGNPTTDTRLPNVYDLYRDLLLDTVDEQEPSCSHAQSISRQDFGVNHQTSLLMSQMLWRLLRHGSIEHHGNFFDLSSGETNPLHIDENVWKSFGFSNLSIH